MSPYFGVWWWGTQGQGNAGLCIGGRRVRACARTHTWVQLTRGLALPILKLGWSWLRNTVKKVTAKPASEAGLWSQTLGRQDSSLGNCWKQNFFPNRRGARGYQPPGGRMLSHSALSLGANHQSLWTPLATNGVSCVRYWRKSSFQKTCFINTRFFCSKQQILSDREDERETEAFKNI